MLKADPRDISQKDFDVDQALKEHLAHLEAQREHLDALIRTVKHTILSKKGDYEMSDRERFEAFKENAIRENEVQYGAEIREKYGEASVEASNRKLKGMSEEAWQQFEGLEKEIFRQLEEFTLTKISLNSEKSQKIGAYASTMALHDLGNVYSGGS